MDAKFRIDVDVSWTDYPAFKALCDELGISFKVMHLEVDGQIFTQNAVAFELPVTKTEEADEAPNVPVVLPVKTMNPGRVFDVSAQVEKIRRELGLPEPEAVDPDSFTPLAKKPGTKPEPAPQKQYKPYKRKTGLRYHRVTAAAVGKIKALWQMHSDMTRKDFFEAYIAPRDDLPHGYSTVNHIINGVYDRLLED